MKTWIIVIAAGALGIASYVLLHGADVAPAPADAPRAQPAPRQLEAPRPAAPPRFAVAQTVAAAEPATAAEPAPPPPPPPSTEQVRERFDAIFSAEAVDPAWNQKAADTLSKGLQAVLPAGSAVRRIECRGTLCRIETSHLDVDGFRAFAQDAFLDRTTRVGTSGFFASLLSEPAGGGPVVAVAFLAREGKELPGPDAMRDAR